MAESMTGRAGGPSAWSTRDLMVISALGAALGVVLVPVIYATMALHAALGPLGMASIARLLGYRGSYPEYPARSLGEGRGGHTGGRGRGTVRNARREA
jgi:hypothetical protein